MQNFFNATTQRRNDAKVFSERGVGRFNPERIGALSPGLRVCELPWVGSNRIFLNPERVAPRFHPFSAATPRLRAATLSGLDHLPHHSQGSSRTRNPGLSDGIPLGFKRGGRTMWIMTRPESRASARHFQSRALVASFTNALDSNPPAGKCQETSP